MKKILVAILAIEGIFALAACNTHRLYRIGYSCITSIL
jgi:hypothetical protein